MTPDEVRMLDNRYALVFIRGERPVMDFKYNILKHPNVRLTTDGGTKPYRHGEDTRSIASVWLDPDKVKAVAVTDTKTHNYILLTEEEVEERIMKLEEKNHEKHEQKEHEQKEHRAAPRPW